MYIFTLADTSDGPNVATLACRQAGCIGVGTMKQNFGGGTGKSFRKSARQEFCFKSQLATKLTAKQV